MIRINQIKIDTDIKDTLPALRKAIAGKLKTDAEFEFRIVKHSIDARSKPRLYHVYSVDVDIKDEVNVLRRSRCRQADIADEKEYIWPKGKTGAYRPLVIGMGPAGLFCGYMLANAGCRPILCDRGLPVEQRTGSVAHFWDTGILDTESNVQFGEGGAGTFSDGKLNTLVNDRYGRNKKVLEIFADHGAPDDILYESKPHIGTDVLADVISSMRDDMISKGAEFRYRHKLTDIILKGKDTVTAIFDNGEEIVTDSLVLAIGHSARDTFGMLYDLGIPMSSKAYAVGLRVLHPQDMIDMARYGDPHAAHILGPAAYKLTHRSASLRGVYSFCMCPGGYVVNASSESGHTAVNGMSLRSRDSGIANSGIIVSVDERDYPGTGPLSGISFQRELEKRAYDMGGGCIPVQSYISYKQGHPMGDIRIKPDGFKGAVKETDIRGLLPEQIKTSFLEGMEAFDRIIPGFAGEEAVLAGIESRTSSPVRIHRGDRGTSECGCIYPCGEGAGYAGGITSAAMDGIYIAEEIWKKNLI